jgi:hypothetical protein
VNVRGWFVRRAMVVTVAAAVAAALLTAALRAWAWPSAGVGATGATFAVLLAMGLSVAALTCRVWGRRSRGRKSNRFVLDATTGISIGGVPIDEFVEKNKHLLDEGGREGDAGTAAGLGQGFEYGLLPIPLGGLDVDELAAQRRKGRAEREQAEADPRWLKGEAARKALVGRWASAFAGAYEFGADGSCVWTAAGPGRRAPTASPTTAPSRRRRGRKLASAGRRPGARWSGASASGLTTRSCC